MNPESLVVLLLRQPMNAYALRIARRYSDVVERDDVLGAAALGLVKAVRGFDPEKGPIRPFAMIWVRREVFLLVKRELTWRKHNLELGYYVESEEAPDTPHEDAERAEVMRALDVSEHAIWRAHVGHDVSVRDLARTYRTSLRQIQNAIARSHRRLTNDFSKRRCRLLKAAA